jgi:hypothetical protein
MDLSEFPSLLDRAFLEYRIQQTRQRLSVSLNSFANYLDFSPPIVNMWLSGSRLPTQGNVERIIPKLVALLDLQVYDILGLPRPDSSLQRLNQVWPRISIENRQKLAELGEMYAAEKDSVAANTPSMIVDKATIDKDSISTDTPSTIVDKVTIEEDAISTNTPTTIVDEVDHEKRNNEKSPGDLEDLQKPLL